MEVLCRVCCGLDVHKKTVAACLRVPGSTGARSEDIRTFATTTRELLQLRYCERTGVDFPLTSHLSGAVARLWEWLGANRDCRGAALTGLRPSECCPRAGSVREVL